MNKRYTLHNQILKNEQKLLNSHQGEGLRPLVWYVQMFKMVLSLFSMKEKINSQSGISPWLITLGLQMNLSKEWNPKHLPKNDKWRSVWKMISIFTKVGVAKATIPIEKCPKPEEVALKIYIFFNGIFF